MGNGFQFIDIILFAMIAAFLVFRLRNTLGKHGGQQGDYHDPFKSKNQKNKPHDEDEDDNVVQLSDRQQQDQDQDEQTEDVEENLAPPRPRHDAGDQDSDDALAEGMMQIQMSDRNFDAGQFLDGANIAFEMILNAYASGDTATLKTLLSPEVYSNFSQAIKEREQAGEILDDTLVEIKRADYLEAYVEARQAFVTVKFISDQVNVTLDENGDVVDGSPNEIITVTDIWTFSRDLRSRDPNWSLVATSSLD